MPNEAVVAKADQMKAALADYVEWTTSVGATLANNHYAFANGMAHAIAILTDGTVDEVMAEVEEAMVMRGELVALLRKTAAETPIEHRRQALTDLVEVAGITPIQWRRAGGLGPYPGKVSQQWPPTGER